MILTEEQKDKIAEVYQRTTDLNEIVREVFDDPNQDGRTKQGRLVRAYMVACNLKFKTSKRERKDEIVFSEDQKAFIIDQATKGASSLAIAALVFPDKDVGPLSMEQRAVFDLMKQVNPDYSPTQDNNIGIANYVAPKSPLRLVKKINDATGLSLEETKLNRQHKICVEKLGINLSNSRFIKIINNYTSKEDRVLFEEEFIRLTWDKPDLTADEINLYMNVCKDIVNLEVIAHQLNKLNDQFDTQNDQENSQTIARFAVLIKDKSAEYNQCGARIQNLISSLQGNRSQRILTKTKQNASILALVQLFQDEEERKNMVEIAEMQKRLVKDEAEKLEGMPEWKARVLGIDKEDVI